MECVEAALKTSFRKEMGVKLSPQSFIEELSVQNEASCNEFFVDDLLDFSNVEEEPEQQQQQQQKEQDSASVCVSLQQGNQSHEVCDSLKNDFASSVPTSDLSVPADDVADLEWLSHFIEDSFSEFSAVFPTVTEVTKDPEPEPVFTYPCFKSPVQTKARSKRTRTRVPLWPLASPSFTDSSTATTATSSSSSSSSFPSMKKPKKKTSSESATTQAPRRCSHCGVQKTPQWRTGPLGPKTLCNACGVRYKSGRLLPEYRPACSPTFSSELHSNHHRKVLEMRRKKETVGGVETGLAPTPVVPSF
ncbi:GATA transcription factor 5-like isoform X2 [Abrus precatorius]|uniref:GATA transcription factor n=1 Tax=Abrus precatorius TaxID=3816 RepID=A0A8B8LZD2_ABRPR|nr:GATA transcription factor 5-like isoform X2 [Abrus precatorius]